MPAIDRADSISVLRDIAKRRLPKAVFDFVDGAAETENTLRRNISDLAELKFRPRYLIDVTERDLSYDVLGHQADIPLIISPTGLSALVWPDADILLARAAARRNIPFTTSTAASTAMETLAEQAPDTRLWFQMYMHKDPEIVDSLINRARKIDIEAIVLTVDVPVLGHRSRDFHNGFTVPWRPNARFVFDALRCASWTYGIARNGVPRMQNLLADANGDTTTLTKVIDNLMDASITWEDVARLRDKWDGKLIIKGILTPEDAALAKQTGADAVWVSNHGGRQLDGAPSTISVLSDIVQTVGSDFDVVMDSGVRQGSDLAKVVALGATPAIGRATLYGVAAGGQSGADKALSILADEYDRCLALLGCTSTTNLTPDYIALAN